MSARLCHARRTLAAVAPEVPRPNRCVGSWAVRPAHREGCARGISNDNPSCARKIVGFHRYGHNGDRGPLALEILTSKRTYFVRTGRNDANDGLTDTAGGAFLTWTGDFV
jgi:hypothetical protein